MEKLTEAARYHIETSTKIQNALYLDQEDFFINGDLKVFPDPPPPVRPPPVEKEENGTLTIQQLDSLRDQFLETAPKGRKNNYREKGQKRIKLMRVAVTCSQVKSAPWDCTSPKRALAVFQFITRLLPTT